MLKKILFLSMACCAAALTYAQRDTSKFREREVLVQEKLSGLKTSLNERNMGNFGFSSIDDLKNAELARPPFELSIVSLEQLRSYNAGTNVNAMFIRSTQYIYPIINSRNQQAVNAMVVDYRSSNSKWEVVSMGRSKQLASSIYQQNKRSPNSYFIATILFLHMDFITYRNGNSYMMIPVTNDAQNKVEAGQAVPAEKIFAIYSPAARRYNGLPM